MKKWWFNFNPYTGTRSEFTEVTYVEQFGSEEPADECSDGESTEEPQKQSEKLLPKNECHRQGIELFKVAQSCAQEQGDRANGNHCPEIGKKLLKDSAHLTMITAVARRKFGYGKLRATSAPVESEIGQFRRLMREHNKPNRLDVVFEIHMDNIKGRMNLLDAAQQLFISKKRKRDEITEDEEQQEDLGNSIPETSIVAFNAYFLIYLYSML